MWGTFLWAKRWKWQDYVDDCICMIGKAVLSTMPKLQNWVMLKSPHIFWLLTRFPDNLTSSVIYFGVGHQTPIKHDILGYQPLNMKSYISKFLEKCLPWWTLYSKKIPDIFHFKNARHFSICVSFPGFNWYGNIVFKSGN